MGNLRTNKIEKFIICLLVLCFYYYIYRYMFQYNSTSTSPTYSDTPNSFKYAKYVILVAIYVFTFARNSKRNVYVDRRIIDSVFLGGIINILLFVRYFFFGSIEIVKIFLISILPLIFLQFNTEKIKYKNIFKIIYSFYWFAIIYESIQVFLFYSTGRLPALGWAGTISVRFGGPWDDPNGWSIALPFFITFCFYYCKKIFLKFILIAIGLIMLVIAQSVTAIGTFVVALFLYNLILRRSVPGILIVAVMGFMIVAYFLVDYYLVNSDFIKNFMELKEDSVSAHIQSFSLEKLRWDNWLFGVDAVSGTESDYRCWLNYGGLLLLIPYFLWLLLCIKNVLFIVRKEKFNNPFWNASLMYQIAFCLSSINLPCSAMFYLFLLFNIINGISLHYLCSNPCVSPLTAVSPKRAALELT